MEMCTGTLEDFVSRKYSGPSPGDSRAVLYQITKGLAHLHSKKIVHRDLKPLNILISQPIGSSPPKMKLADFGISKRQKREYYFSKTGTTGTVGWAAPELFDDTKDTFCLSVDIFSLGCIFGYVLTGHHPFGSTVFRIGNILDNKLCWTDKKKLKDRGLKELIKKMIACNHKNRPDVEVVLNHPSISQPLPVATLPFGTTSAKSSTQVFEGAGEKPKKTSTKNFSSLFSRQNTPTPEKNSRGSVFKDSSVVVEKKNLSSPTISNFHYSGVIFDNHKSCIYLS